MTGLLSVNTMSEFVILVKQIIDAAKSKTTEIKVPSVIALVGPSGSGKTNIAKKLCEDERFDCPKTYCTKISPKHKFLTEEEFAKQKFVEKTRYAGIHYGTKKEDIQSVLDEGKFAVMPLDMCGAISMKRHFPTVIIFIDRDKESLIKEIIEDDYGTEEKALRLLSIDAEKRNREICDCVVSNRKMEGVQMVLDIIFGK